MKTTDILIWGGVGIAALYILSKLTDLQLFRPADATTPDSGDWLNITWPTWPGGEGSPTWAHIFGPLGDILYSIFGTGGAGPATDGGGAGGTKEVIIDTNKKTIFPKTAGPPKGYKPVTKQAFIEEISKGYLTATPHKAKMIEQAAMDIAKTITVKPGVIQPMTQARITSRIHYGGWGGR